MSRLAWKGETAGHSPCPAPCAPAHGLLLLRRRRRLLLLWLLLLPLRVLLVLLLCCRCRGCCDCCYDCCCGAHLGERPVLAPDRVARAPEATMCVEGSYLRACSYNSGTLQGAGRQDKRQGRVGGKARM